MSVWSRFTRWVKSVFGGAISAVEDPRLILEQNIRELNDQVPKMNENIATVKANVMMLQKEGNRLNRQIESLTSKIKAAIQAERDDIAQQYAMQLEKAKEELQRNKEQLKYASAAYDKSLQVKKAFMREKENKIQEARDAMRAHERAKWQSRVADAMEQFEVSGVDQTHEEMVQRLNQQTARSEARMELALDSVDTEALKIEEDAESIRAAELVKQFKMEMNMDAGEKASASSKEETAEGQVELPEEPAREESEKTIGKERRRTQ
jgi:phage shock protein A